MWLIVDPQDGLTDEEDTYPTWISACLAMTKDYSEPMVIMTEDNWQQWQCKHQGKMSKLSKYL